MADVDDSSRPRQEELWEAHARELVRYATLLVGPADAPDVVAIAFSKLTASSRLDLSNPRAYLFRVATNVAFDQLRSAKRRQRRDLAAALPESVAQLDSHVDVRRAVARLSVGERAVVYFAYWEDLDTATIAALLQINPGTVRRRLERARFQLRRILE